MDRLLSLARELFVAYGWLPALTTLVVLVLLALVVMVVLGVDTLAWLE